MFKDHHFALIDSGMRRCAYNIVSCMKKGLGTADPVWSDWACGFLHAYETERLEALAEACRPMLGVLYRDTSDTQESQTLIDRSKVRASLILAGNSLLKLSILSTGAPNDLLDVESECEVLLEYLEVAERLLAYV